MTQGAGQDSVGATAFDEKELAERLLAQAREQG
jgi:hypothetical protein